MKFAKTYLQTMTDPSFPKEWREKGLEYKELKKLINGVVAELESLGLSADVLRDLLEPPQSDQSERHQPAPAAAAAAAAAKAASNSSANGGMHARPSNNGDDAETEIDTDELSTSLVAGLARLSTGRPAPSAYIDPLSPLMEEPEEARRRRSAEQAMNVPPFPPDVMPAPLMDADSPMAATATAASEASSSPAREWIASINHSRPSSSRGAQGKSRSRSRRVSDSGRSASGSSNTSSREHSLQPEAASSSALLDASDDSTDFVRASPMSMLGIRKRRDESAERASSAEAEAPAGSHDRALSPTSSWRMGKKDLEELRRNSHSGNATRPAVPGAKGGRRASQGADASQSDADDGDDERHDWGGHAWRERQDLGWDPPRPRSALPRQRMNGNAAVGQSSSLPSAGATSPASKPRWVQGKDGRRARAEYELAGTPEHPIPRIKLIIESPVHSDTESGSESGSDDGKITELPPSAPGSRRPSQSEEGASANEPVHPTVQQSAPGPQLMRTREIIIPLTADTEFLDTLTASLTKLSELQKTQKDTFVTSTENLCASVARAASPYATKNDLYVWREIFSLWVDMQIFESQREKDRGELSVDESEARLKRFAEELAKRGWLAESAVPQESPAAGGAKLSRKKTAMESALTLPMKDSRSVSTVEDFLRLNLALLDLKKFQRVNVEAARKILKKHDKRTALTASSGLRAFVRQQEAERAMSAAMGGGRGLMMPAESTGTLVAPAYGTHPSLAALLPSSTTGLLSESLPHILLSLLTSTLLPILPTVDDYSCAICTGLAWRPIRLDCAHLFCIRCLVKLQKQGKADCPLCRAPNVVSSADGRNMDEATVNMLRLWFPQEVSEKDQENEKDRKKEELAEMGFEHHKCVVM